MDDHLVKSWFVGDGSVIGSCGRALLYVQWRAVMWRGLLSGVRVLGVLLGAET